MIEAKNLHYDYIKRDENDNIAEITHAVNGIDLSIDEGEYVAVIGANGSGKSTFARLVNGLILPTDGCVLVGGYDTADEEHTWDVRSLVGMVFQNPDNQIVASVVEEDVAFGPENLGVPSDEIVRRVAAALESVGMSKYADRSPNRLSGGQKQRIAIAGALAMHPKCILLDEATAMLDPIGRREIMEVASRLNREQGMTVINITHYMEEAAMAERIIVLNHGRVAIDGTPAQVFARESELGALGLELPPAAQLMSALRRRGVPAGAAQTAAVLDDETAAQIIASALKI